MTGRTQLPCTCALTALAAASLCAAAPGGPARIGAMGDSLSDEYAEETYDYAANWLEQLVAHRGLDAGPTAASAGQPDGTWGEPRRTGYAFNWARSGATSAALLSAGQHTGLAAQVGPEGIDYAVLFIGANDFNPTGSAYFNIYHGFWSQGQIDAHVAGILDNVETALAAVAPTGTGLVLVNILDFGLAPAVWDSFLYGDPDNRENVAAVIEEVNFGLAQLAREQGAPLVDALAFARAVFGTHHDLQEFLVLGNVTLSLWESDTTGNDNPTAGFVDDGAHPHTHLQGLMANVLVEALHAGYGAGVAPFSEQEILAHAGLAYGGEDTVGAQLGDFRDYVVNYAVPGDLDADGMVGVTDFLTLLSVWGACPAPPEICPADLDADGTVGVTDFLALLAGWG